MGSISLQRSYRNYRRPTLLWQRYTRPPTVEAAPPEEDSSSSEVFSIDAGHPQDDIVTLCL